MTVRTCPRCGYENAAEARFCSHCGEPLEEPKAEAREERKVVSILFADLVGSTSLAEELDPEDVRATLSPYYLRLRSELERHGGTVEKFIGDAVMAVFGLPTVHEDDALRAVRAGLGIRGRVRRLCLAAGIDEPLEVRVGVESGEAATGIGPAGQLLVTGPVVTATRTWSRPSSAIASRIARPARTARSGSSSWAAGAPNTAMTASPMNFSTVPPWRSSSERRRR